MQYCMRHLAINPDRGYMWDMVDYVKLERTQQQSHEVMQLLNTITYGLPLLSSICDVQHSPGENFCKCEEKLWFIFLSCYLSVNTLFSKDNSSIKLLRPFQITI